VAKLKAPLFSLGASQQLGKALVFFGWKGLNLVREYVVPANPKTTLQTAQRTHLSDAVAAVHARMAEDLAPFNEADKSAYALWASVIQSATTWFNQCCRHWIDQARLGRTPNIFRNQTVDTPTADSLRVTANNEGCAGNDARWYYGTSKTALINSVAADIVGANYQNTIAGLAKTTKYFFQLRITEDVGRLGNSTGILHGTTTA